MIDDLRGRAAVVTGAASGIGLALAERFAGEGMKVVLADVEEPALASARERLEAAGATVLALVTDVADPDQVDLLAERSRAAFGAVDIVCNNAGVSAGGPVWELSRAEWDWILGVNLGGVINGVRSFVPGLIEQGRGHVVNTASMAGLSFGALGAYSVTKHAVVALSESLRISLSALGSVVGVSVLCPGWVSTRILESERNQPPAARAAAARRSLTPEMQAARAFVAQLVAEGMPPAEVASQVVDAIRQDRFYVITHPDMLAAVEARSQAILRGGYPDVAGLL